MPSGMTKHENIAKALKARLSELTTRVGEIDSELRKPLSADLEEQATDLENQGALEAIENSEIHEIHQIREALKRISEGTYGICAHCGDELTPNVWRRCRLRLDVFHALRENLSSALTAGIGAKVVRLGERGNEASAVNGLSNLSKRTVGRRCHRYAAMNTLRSIVASTALLTLPAAALRGRPCRDGAREFRCL